MTETRLPDFLIIGAQRCGTTALYEYLSSHPDVIPAVRKELHYFDTHYDRGQYWYASKLRRDATASNGLMGEATPYYLFHPCVPKRVYELTPRVKLVVLLRDPVTRAFSGYHHSVRLGNETEGFSQALDLEASRLASTREKLLSGEICKRHQRYSYVARGEYIDQLLAWRQFFPNEQMCVIRSESLYATPEASLRRIMSFLSLREWDFNRFSKANALSYGSISDNDRIRLQHHFRPFNERLYEYLQVTQPWWPYEYS